MTARHTSEVHWFYIMTKSHRLHPVIKITEKKERSVAIAVAESKRSLDGHMSRLDHLNTYLNEYIAMFRTMGEKGLSAQQMQEYRIFLANLESAVTQQRSLVTIHQETYEKNKKLWYSARGKVKALGIVIARHEQKEQQEDMRRDQKELDDRPKNINNIRVEEK